MIVFGLTRRGSTSGLHWLFFLTVFILQCLYLQLMICFIIEFKLILMYLRLSIDGVRLPSYEPNSICFMY